MGNQAQIRKGSTAISTSTRNFPNRLGIDTRVHLGSAEVYRYINFEQIPEFVEVAATVAMQFRFLPFFNDRPPESEKPLPGSWGGYVRVEGMKWIMPRA